MVTNERPSFPFVVGCGRSGTTLLRAMLDSHPNLAVPAETKFIARMGKARGRYELPGGFAVDEFVEDMYRMTDLDARWALPRATIHARLRETAPHDYPEAVRRVFATMAEARGKSRYGNKTPIHVMTMPLLARLFPESRFVHLIRDGRDVALSYFDTEFGPKTITEAALHWRRHVRTGRADGRRLGPARYVEIRYEDLIRDPEQVLRSLCDFLDLEFDALMLQYHERSADVIGGIKLPQYHQRVALPPTRRRDWQAEMKPADTAHFEVIAGSLLETLRYERAFPKTDLRIAARTIVSAVVDETRRGARGLIGRLVEVR